MMKFPNSLLWIGALAVFSLACVPAENSNLFPVPLNLIMTQKVRYNVIYGEDHRKDLYAVTNSQMFLHADSTVALIFQENLEPLDERHTRIKGRSYAQTYQLCPEEPFYDQQIAAFCSGFLIGPQTIATAGHCINAQSCSHIRFVFGFSIKQAGIFPEFVPNDDVFSCKEVVHSQNLTGQSHADFAIVTLDRPVLNHKPLVIRTSGQIQAHEPIYVIGHPAGLPTKVADGAWVRDNSPKTYFVANLDTYGGNSGSAVINESTGEVEGILVRGELDFTTKKDTNCQISNVCTNDGCMGEHVTRIEYVWPYLQWR